MAEISPDIIEECKNYKRTAQKFIYEKLYSVMFAVCRRYIKNDEEIMEVLNDGFMILFQRIGQFKGEGSFEGWVRKIFINKAIDHYRMNKKYRETLQYVEEYKEEQVFVDTDIVSSYNIEDLYNAIHCLPPVYKIVFNLYAIDGFSHKEIAGKINITEGTSRWYLSESRKMLKEKISIMQTA